VTDVFEIRHFNRKGLSRYDVARLQEDDAEKDFPDNV
jgi:hypothetical protein